jgi:hypothetical protein
MLTVGKKEEEINASYYMETTKCRHTVRKHCEIIVTHA